MFDYLHAKMEIEEVFEEFTSPDMPKLRDLMSRPSPFDN